MRCLCCGPPILNEDADTRGGSCQCGDGRAGLGSEIPCTIVMNEPGRKSTSGVKYPDHNKHLDRCDCPCGAGNDRADDEAER
jgi:hypothetical protein